VADQAICREVDRPEEDIVGERGVRESADLVLGVGEQDEPSSAIANVDSEVLDPRRGGQWAARKATLDFLEDASGGFWGYGLVPIV
jgi:hypothetical protein